MSGIWEDKKLGIEYVKGLKNGMVLADVTIIFQEERGIVSVGAKKTSMLTKPITVQITRAIVKSNGNGMQLVDESGNVLFNPLKKLIIVFNCNATIEMISSKEN